MASYSSYFDELNLFKAAEKKVLVGFTTDSWNVGTQKYKAFLAVNKMIKMIAKTKISAIDIPMFEVAQGPHYDELQKLFESFWIPDFSSTEQFLLQFDLIVIPDPVLAKYMVESYYEKEAKVAKKTAFFQKLSKQPWGVLDQYPPKERYEYERFKNLPRQKWIRKYPPIAVVGRETYNRMKNHGQVEYFSEGVEDFSLYLPDQMVPSKKVLVLRYKNRFGTLVDSLSLKGMNVTSAYPVTWMRKEWSPQEERLAKEVDVVYFHEVHAVLEWHSRLGDRVGSVVAACQNEEVAKAAKVAGFRDVFFAKKGTSDVLYKTILDAVDHAKTIDKNAIKK
jgi:uroporphyrinogen-III synthase